MTRNLKALLLAATAAMAMSAIAATAAQAHTPPVFHSAVAETTITSTPDGAHTSTTAHQVFDIPGGGSTTCRTVDTHGLIKESTPSTITVTTAFTNCTAFGQPATVHMGGCDFTFHANPPSVTIGNHATGNCTTNPIQITAVGCVVDIGPQTLTGLTYTNIKPGATHEVTLSAAVTGIVGNETGVACPAPGAFTTGEFTTGNNIITGEVPGGAMVDVTWTPTVA